MKNTKVILCLSMVLMLLLGMFYFVGNGSSTGFAIVGGGGASDLGQQVKANPKYGIVYGSFVYTIKDVQGNILNSEVPSEELPVYFVSTGVSVDWNANITCGSQISGNVNNIDADSDGTQCISTQYSSPTVYICTVKDSNGNDVTIYKILTSMMANNVGCFAGKIASGNYDIYV